MPKLLQISAFFKNDTKEGVGITLTPEIGDLDFILSTIQTYYQEMWNQAQDENNLPELINDLRSQLFSIGGSKGTLDFGDATIVIGNIWLLENHGQLITDEYNGLFLAYSVA